MGLLDKFGSKEILRMAAQKLLNGALSVVNKKITDFGEIKEVKLETSSIRTTVSLWGIDQLIDVECDDFSIDEDNTIHLNHFKSSAKSVENALNRFAAGPRSFNDSTVNLAIAAVRKFLY